MDSKYAKLYAHKAIKLQSWYACFYLKEWNLVMARNNNNNNRLPEQSNELALANSIFSHIITSSFQPQLHPLWHLLWLPPFSLHEESCICTYAYLWKTSQVLKIKSWDMNDSLHGAGRLPTAHCLGITYFQKDPTLLLLLPWPLPSILVC